jgi:hypothetical protein
MIQWLQHNIVTVQQNSDCSIASINEINASSVITGWIDDESNTVDQDYNYSKRQAKLQHDQTLTHSPVNST